MRALAMITEKHEKTCLKAAQHMSEGDMSSAQKALDKADLWKELFDELIEEVS